MPNIQILYYIFTQLYFWLYYIIAILNRNLFKKKNNFFWYVANGYHIMYKYYFELFLYFYFTLLFKTVRIGIQQIAIKNKKYEIIDAILDDAR